MIHTEAYNVYQQMLTEYPRVAIEKGCGSSANKPFISLVMTFGKMQPPNPFEEETIAHSYFEDLVYFVAHSSEAHDCPFKTRCATAAVRMLENANLENPYEPEPVVEAEEEPAKIWHIATDDDLDDADSNIGYVDTAATTMAIEFNPPKHVLGVVPEKKNRWRKKKG